MATRWRAAISSSTRRATRAAAAADSVAVVAAAAAAAAATVAAVVAATAVVVAATAVAVAAATATAAELPQARFSQNAGWRRARPVLPALPSLHVGVVRPAAPLGDHPHDVLGRVLDVARLAVHAVLRVDLQAVRAGGLVLHEFVHARRAVALLGPGVLREVDVHRNGRILQREVDRLVLLVVGVRDEHRRELVEGELAVGLRVLDGRAFRSGLEVLVVRLLDVQREGRL